MTNDFHSRASIIAVEPQRIIEELTAGKVVIVAGFQGITDRYDITTLGRGGSDTTAVALAIALKATECEIYTDVDGVYTADPRIEPKARKVNVISYEEMLELASVGARVMHPRAVELGGVYGMPIIVRSSFNDNPGTVIRGGMDEMENRNRVTGIADDANVAKVTIIGVPDHPGIAYKIFQPLAEAGVNVDTIVQNKGKEGITDVSFTVPSTSLAKALKIAEPILQRVEGKEIVSTEKIAKVSIVGTGIQNTPGYAAKMFKALADADINIDLISTSDIRITCLIEQTHLVKAVRVLHEAFELEKADN
jgi:aspartate kinase